MLYFIPLIAALVGWLTNYLAVKMLFHPRKPLNLGLFKIQGVFPKRQASFAKKIGKLVGEQLLSVADLKTQLVSDQKMDHVLALVDEKLDLFLKEKLTAAMPMLAMVMGDDMRGKIKATLMVEFKTMLPALLDRYFEDLEKDVDLVDTVTQKVSSFSFDQLEKIIHGVINKELRFIELVGAVLGGMIGLLQLLLVQWST